MIVKASEYSELLTAKGIGAWGRLSFKGDFTELRTVDMRQFDGYPRIYFDGTRKQVSSNIRYQPMSRIPYVMAPGYAYRIATNVEIIRELPKSLSGFIVPTEEFSEAGGIILSGPILPEYRGPIGFTVMSVGGIEIDEMVVLAYLMFFGEPVKQTRAKPKVKRKVREAKT